MNKYLRIAAISGAIAVAIGAFGSHGLKPYMSLAQQGTFKVGSTYHFIHTVVLLVIAFNINKYPKLKWSFNLILAGIICFSGSLYLLSLKQLFGGDAINFLGPITPIGGLLFIAGWLNLLRID